MPNIGDFLPDISLILPDGPRALSTWHGRWLVLYFYPRDATPGCTTEASDFSALAPEFQKLGADIVGVSRDSTASHARFAERNAITFPLASDEDGSVCAAFGVWAEKSLYGRKFMGIVRSTFLIGPDGRVVNRWLKVKVAGHARAVLQALESAR